MVFPLHARYLRVKRKSRPQIDDTEDGARAILIEEGISTWIFDSATKLNYFDGIGHLDYPLLKAIGQQVSGYEVAKCPLWMWERAWTLTDTACLETFANTGKELLRRIERKVNFVQAFFRLRG